MEAYMSVVTIRYLNTVLFVGNIPAPLTKQELQVVTYLASHQGKVCTTSMLLDALYSQQAAAGQKIVDVIVCKIKKKIRMIAPGAEDTIRKIWGRGYMWGCPDEAPSQVHSGTLPHNDRWVASRKAMVVDALLNGTVSEAAVLAHYPDMTVEELREWVILFLRHHARGLRTTKIELYRNT
jgi:Transcriptional regulatory protein, C terminal/Protein of unknown function (DUF1153)